MHIAHLRRIERPGTVHRRPIVPDHQIKLLPLVRIDKLPLRRVLDQIAQKGSGLRNWPSDDRSGMRSEIQRFPPSGWMAPDPALLYWRELPALLLREVAEADLGAGEQLAVLTDQSLALGLGFVVKRIIRGTHVGELGIATLIRDDAGRQQGVFGGYEF